jgi:alpha-L-rhamnosidase
MTMLDRGASTVRESWNGVDTDGVAHESVNQNPKGAVMTFLHEYITGVRPAAPGYAEEEIAPTPGGPLTSAAATLDTRHGPVNSSWRIEDGRFYSTSRPRPGCAPQSESRREL